LTAMARPIFRRAVLATLAPAAFLAAPTSADALGYHPPLWFEGGVAKVKTRPGATCPGPKPFTRTFNFPTYDGGLRREEGTTEDCLRRLPKALAKSFRILRPPFSHHAYREGCHGEFRHLTSVDPPDTWWDDTTWFRCDIFYRPVIEGRPNPRTWFCFRAKFFHQHHFSSPDDTDESDHGGTAPIWFSGETKYWQFQRFESLSRCLNPKYRQPK
jgi:hypothetical protein